MPSQTPATGIRPITLTVAANPDLIRVVTSSVEQAARAFGLDDASAMNLALGSEEIFVKVCRDAPGASLDVTVTPTAAAVRLDLCLRGADLDLRAFNLAAGISASEEADLDDMGLFLAARLVDDLQIQEEAGPTLRLTLVKERSYPDSPVAPLAVPDPVDRVSIRAPIAEELLLFAGLLHAADPDDRWEPALTTPGRLADLVAGGEWRARGAFGPRGELVGAIFWRLTARSAEAFGPFVFGQIPERRVADSLIDACVGDLARGTCVGLLFMDPPEPFPAGAAEYLGDWFTPGGRRVQARYRLLQEDPGSVIWTDPALEPWLRTQCDRLVLPRQIRAVADAGRRLPEHSVFFTRLLRQQSAELQPVRLGADVPHNLAAHVERFASEDIRDVRCRLDLGQAWQSGFMSALLAGGFEPRFLLPGRGRGDEVLFQKATS